MNAWRAALGVATLVACGGGKARDPAMQPRASDLQPVEAIAGLPLRLPDGAAQDCRISTVIRRRFAGQRVLACGAVTLQSTAADWDRTGHCIDLATRAGLPYLAEDKDEGTDSDLAMATIGVQDGDHITVYRFGFDSDPCGGGCPERGGTTSQKCVKLLSAKGGCAGADCAGCAEWVPDEPCFFGGPAGGGGMPHPSADDHHPSVEDMDDASGNY